MNYPSSYRSGQVADYVISFNEEFVSIIGNGEVLWNLEYGSNLVMNSCYEVRLMHYQFFISLMISIVWLVPMGDK